MSFPEVFLQSSATKKLFTTDSGLSYPGLSVAQANTYSYFLSQRHIMRTHTESVYILTLWGIRHKSFLLKCSSQG